MAEMISRPDPAPKCLHCRADAVGQYEASEGPRPLCEAHRSHAPDWCHYAPAAGQGDPEPAPVEAPKPVAIGVMSEARRMLALIGDAGTRDVQAELLALSLERAYQTGRADALLAAHQAQAETTPKAPAARRRSK